MDDISGKESFIVKLIQNTATQIVLFLGIIFALGLILYLFARLTRRVFAFSLGPRFEVYFTAWLGTPIHELGHALFCILFGHKIVKVNLFSPDSSDGTLGYVKHSYNSKSIFQQIGNLFIGIGPIIFGSLVIYLLIHLLVPNKDEIIDSLQSYDLTLKGFTADYIKQALHQHLIVIKSIFKILFDLSNFSSISFWVFIYICISISTHMELSPPDIKSFGVGLLFLVFFLLIINSIILLFDLWGFTSSLGKWWSYLSLESNRSIFIRMSSLLATLMSISVLISGIVFVVFYIILTSVSLIRGKGLINPF